MVKLIRKIVYKTSDVVVQQLQKGNNNIAVVVGSGHAFSSDDHGQITSFRLLKNNYGTDCSVYAIYYSEMLDREMAKKQLAGWINEQLLLANKIILHGYSQCAIDFLNLYQWLNKWSRLRTHVVSVSAPVRSIPEDTFKTICEELDCHIVVSKCRSFLFSNQVIPLQDQIPQYGIYDQITASNAKSAMCKSSIFVKALM